MDLRRPVGQNQSIQQGDEMRWSSKRNEKPAPSKPPETVTAKIIDAASTAVVFAAAFFAFAAWAIRRPVTAKRELLGPSTDWQLWFAWFPVTVERQELDRRWLEWVERKLGDSGEIRYQEPAPSVWIRN
ncbi:hypothetical protein Pam5_15 [Pseudanabaena phage Pam5]|nr:hypothetical protein Pam5_15 [Pseudanabaena phage Pam5]